VFVQFHLLTVVIGWTVVVARRWWFADVQSHWIGPANTQVLIVRILGLALRLNWWRMPGDSWWPHAKA
jgi:hypothetical protein